eukprot:Em0041g10a
MRTLLPDAVCSVHTQACAEYLVLWQGYSKEECSWLVEDAMTFDADQWVQSLAHTRWSPLSLEPELLADHLVLSTLVAPTILTAMMNVEGGPANRIDPLSVGIQVKI